MTGKWQPEMRYANLPEPARHAVDEFCRQFGHRGGAGPITVAWAPGRANLIGEHTDYNGGFVLPVAIDRVIAVAGRAIPGTRSHCYSQHHQRRTSFPAGRMQLVGRGPRLRGSLWTRYVRGVAVQLAALADAPATPAHAAAIVGNVPAGGGMSSSAALEVALAAFAAALGGPRLPPMATARLCQRVDNENVGVRTGIMDQAASCLGRKGHAILLDCRSLAYKYVPVRLPGIVLAVFDTGVPHTLAGSAYNERRGQCEQAASRLARAIAAADPSRRVSSLRDITSEDLERHAGVLPETLLRRARHVVRENARVLAAVEALRAGDTEGLGRLLYASHASLRDDYEVSCPELDAAVEIASGVPGVLGARLMGAGFGGSVLILVGEDALPTLRAALTAAYPERTGREGTLHVCRIAGGPADAQVAPPISVGRQRAM
jgi:galactokinase